MPEEFEPARFSDVKVGDIVCLNHFPYKPIEVAYKSKSQKGLLLKAYYIKVLIWFDANLFDAQGYIFYKRKNG